MEAREGQSTEGLDHIKWKLQNFSLMLRVQPTSTPVPTEPCVEVICQYTDILCTTQKQTNLTNSLLQDTAIFNAHHPTNLEEWLMDLETATDLTNEHHAKLSKAKSRGLTCPLVTEAINSEKKWDEIKDLLKFCNANITHIHLTLHGYTAVGELVPSSLHSPV